MRDIQTEEKKKVTWREVIRDELRFSTPFEKWKPVLDWVYLGFMGAQACAYLYAGILLKDEYAFDAALGYFLVTMLFYFWQDTSKRSSKLIKSLFALVDLYEEQAVRRKESKSDEPVLSPWQVEK
jgi:hypothetical protein